MLLFVLFVILDVLNNPVTLQRTKRLFYINIALLIMAMLFKILHLTGANPLIIKSISITPILYFIQLFMRKNKPAEEIAKALFITFFAAYALFSVLHWKYGFEMMLITIASFLVYFIITGIKFMRNRKRSA